MTNLTNQFNDLHEAYNNAEVLPKLPVVDKVLFSEY